jgi:hypothetical protein
MDPEQAVQAGAIAEPGAGEVGDDHGHAGGQGRGELIVDLLRVRQVDLSGKRHDHGPATCQLLRVQGRHAITAAIVPRAHAE